MKWRSLVAASAALLVTSAIQSQALAASVYDDAYVTVGSVSVAGVGFGVNCPSQDISSTWGSYLVDSQYWYNTDQVWQSMADSFSEAVDNGSYAVSFSAGAAETTSVIWSEEPGTLQFHEESGRSFVSLHSPSRMYQVVIGPRQWVYGNGDCTPIVYNIDKKDSGGSYAISFDPATADFRNYRVVNAEVVYPAGYAGTPIPVEFTDTDGDNLPNTWETEGLDIDADGSVDLDLPAMGASPNHKDVFIEVDWMNKSATCIWVICWGGRSFAPDQSALDDVRAAFANSPVNNPDGTQGIRLHIDSGASSVMNPVTGATWGSRSRSNQVAHIQSLGTKVGNDYQWGAFDSTKESNTDPARRGVFHYALYADTYAGSGSSGISRGIVAADFMVTDGHSSWGNGFTRTQERGTFMHELGHGLGLLHGGDINDAHRSGYQSIMNYDWQLIGIQPGNLLDYSRTSPFVDWDHLRFDGGAIGALGESATIPDETAEIEPHVDELKDLGLYGLDGDGVLAFAGPSVLFADTGIALLMYDVTNVGSVDDTYTVTIDGPGTAYDGSASAIVTAGGTVQIAIPVSTSGFAAGSVTVNASLSSTQLGSALSESSNEVTVPDMTDDQVRAAAADALAQLESLPTDAGLDPSVKTQVETALNEALDEEPPTFQWSADVVLKGDRRSSYTTSLDTATFSPSRARPKSVRLTSASELPLLRVTANRSKYSHPLRGRLTTRLPRSGTLFAKITKASWRNGALQLRGSWVSTTRSSVNGTFKVTLTRPPGA